MSNEEIVLFLNANIGKKIKVTSSDSEPEVVLLLSTDSEGFQGYLIGDDPPTRQWWQTDEVSDAKLVDGSQGGAGSDTSPALKYFDFKAAAMRRLEAATNDVEHLCARTAAGKEVFESAAVRAGLRVLHKDDPIRLPEGPCLIIGIATWSDLDMIALDSAVDRIRQRNIPTWVFDIDEIQFIFGFQTMMPQVDMQPTETPVLAFYVDRTLRERGKGQDSVRWLEQL